MDSDVIKAASTSPLGILALLILVVSTLATAFFNKAPTRVKVWIFLLIFGAACVFGYTVIHAGKSRLTTSTVASLSDVSSSPASPPAPVPTPAPVSTPAAGPGPAQAAGEVLPDSSVLRLAPSDLAGLSKDDLKIARNEIYARHGYIFSTADMRAYFGKLSWYRPMTSQVELTPTEAANVATIRRAEAAP